MAPALKSRTLAFLLHLSSTTAAASILTPKQALGALERRQTSCPASNPVSCSTVDPKLPANFCCASNTSCISIDSSSSALCCPNSGPCTAIQPINCDVGLQNAADVNAGPIFTSRLNDKLPTCANACCPFGYTCSQHADGSSFCLITASKAITSLANSSLSSATSTTLRPVLSSSSSLLSSSTPTPTVTSTVTTTPTTQASGIDSTKPQPKGSSNPFPPGVFLAGLLPGIVVGALCVLAWVIVTGRAKKGITKGDTDMLSNPSMYGKRLEIADPYNDTNSRRSAFVQKTKTFGKSARTLFGKKDRPDGTPGLPFDSADQGWKNLTPPKNIPIPVNAHGRQIPAGASATTPTAATMQAPVMYGSESRPYAGPANNLTYPVTPSRNNRYTVIDDTTGEIIRIYSPPHVERPSAAVAPLRGMNARRRSRDSGWGDYESRDDKVRPNGRSPHPTTTDDRSFYAPSNYETLTPATYNGSGSQGKPSQPMGGGRRGRPETTFTDMLRAINFPDPVKNAPSMPMIPRGYR